MWKEWLARTLTPRRAEPMTGAAVRKRAPTAEAPDLEADGMHPGADEFRAALDRLEDVD